MYGPDILARFLQEPTVKADKYGRRWQYNSQSDRHSQVGSWGVAFDLLLNSSLLRRHVEDRKVVMGVNHVMRDFATHRQKKLDLVIARPAGPNPGGPKTFAAMARRHALRLTPAEEDLLLGLPTFVVADVGAALVAMEAKATMTAHVKALPRLYDELNSSHLAVHGNSPRALAIGYIQVNAAPVFFSSVRNRHIPREADFELNVHKQPSDTERVLRKIEQLPRRSHSSETGFDGIGVSVLDFRNDGSPVHILSDPPAPATRDAFHYGSMIRRMANEYDTRFAEI